MSAAPVASDNDTIFTITPASSLSAATTFKVKITTSVTDISCNTLRSDNKSIVGFSTSPSGLGTISGSVQMDNGSPFYGVSVSDALWGSTVVTTTSDSDGDFSQTPLYLGWHSVTYSKSGYLSQTLKKLLETDGQTLNLQTVRLLQDNCTSGTMSGTITNAVTGDNMSGVTMWYANGIKKDYYIDGGFTKFDDSISNGAWSLNKSSGWYTIMSFKSGYYRGYHDAKVCGDQALQNNSLRKELNEGEMSIMLRWPKLTGTDLDSHLQIPDNASGTSHVYYAVNNFYYATNTNTCSSCSSDQLSDNVTLDKDHSGNSSPASPPGDETTTIQKVRSGTYGFSVHNLTDSGGGTTNYEKNLAQSGAWVELFYCPVGTDCSNEDAVDHKIYKVPNKIGTLWRVFTYNSSDSGDSGDGYTESRTMSYQNNPGNVY
jgi:hypothetical protein